MKILVDLYLGLLTLPKKTPSIEYLRELQKQHIETIPHENVNGIYNIHTSFDIPYLLKKFILEKRGGMCFELNYAFGWLLHELGFKVELILANVVAYDYAQENNPYPTHPILVVYLEEKKYLADVGWSNSYRNPLSLAGKEYSDQTGKYRVSSTQDDRLVMQKYLANQMGSDESEWHDQFIFNKPTQPLQIYTYPKGYLAANTYTHVGKGYLFTNLFHFSKVRADGHTSLWGDKIINKSNVDQTRVVSEQNKAIPIALCEDFNVEKETAKKCVKLKRSRSMLSFYRPIEAADLIDEVNQTSFSSTCLNFK